MRGWPRGRWYHSSSPGRPKGQTATWWRVEATRRQSEWSWRSRRRTFVSCPWSRAAAWGRSPGWPCGCPSPSGCPSRQRAWPGGTPGSSPSRWGSCSRGRLWTLLATTNVGTSDTVNMHLQKKKKNEEIYWHINSQLKNIQHFIHKPKITSRYHGLCTRRWKADKHSSHL